MSCLYQVRQGKCPSYLVPAARKKYPLPGASPTPAKPSLLDSCSKAPQRLPIHRELPLHRLFHPNGSIASSSCKLFPSPLPRHVRYFRFLPAWPDQLCWRSFKCRGPSPCCQSTPRPVTTCRVCSGVVNSGIPASFSPPPHTRVLGSDRAIYSIRGTNGGIRECTYFSRLQH